MAQTFDIRFARTAGLAAMLEVPENAFRWKGGGLLRIDAHGISIGLKRSLLALFGGKRMQRIPTENLRAVYREGDALRVEFQSGESARVVLPFWANDRDAAAQIVRLLPTRQTVEMEEATESAKPRADWRMLFSLGAALSAIAVGTWAIYQRTQSTVTTRSATVIVATPVEAPVARPTADSVAQEVKTSAKPASVAPWYEAPAIPLNGAHSVSATVAKPTLVKPAELPNATASSIPSATVPDVRSTPRAWVVHATPDGIVPFVPGTTTYAVARRQLDLFLAESNTLRDYFQDARYTAHDQRFQEIEKLWARVMVRVGMSPDFEDPELKPLQEIELAVSRAWRRALTYYADPAMLVSADAEVEFAEMLQVRATQFVR